MRRREMSLRKTEATGDNQKKKKELHETRRKESVIIVKGEKGWRRDAGGKVETIAETRLPSLLPARHTGRRR